jgi:nucleoside-triphosphatase THEP1
VKPSVKTVPYSPISPVWLRAAVVGSIWASLEIIIGSFLHNLRVPFSGTILAVMSVYLIIAFVQIWNDSGLVWRAGLICALMKSVSPSAVIIGPMTGIMLEALLLEIFILAFGRNLFGYIIGGAVAVLSSLLHKLITLLLLYGFDFVRILSGLYQFSVRQVKLEETPASAVIAIISALYIIAGIAGAIGGFLAGKAYIRNRERDQSRPVHNLKSENSLFSHTSPHKYSIGILFLNLAAIVICLLLINSAPLLPAILCSAGYITVCLLYYRQSLNRLRKPAIWIQFALIALLSAFLWNTFSHEGLFDRQGLTAGIKMIWRAIIVIIGFAAISVEMKNPLIKSVLYNRGLTNLYQALTMAFAALPSVISQLPTAREMMRNRQASFGYLFRSAESLLALFEEEQSRRPEIFIITGSRQQGKTSHLKELTATLRSSHVKLAGFLSEGVHSGGKRTGFNLTDLKTGESTELCRTDDRYEGPKQGDYRFNPAALVMGENILGSSLIGGTEVIIIDEIGPIEISGKGWYSAIEKLCSSTSVPQIWTVRRSLVEKAVRRWNTGTVHIIDAGLTDVKETASLVFSSIQNRGG